MLMPKIPLLSLTIASLLPSLAAMPERQAVKSNAHLHPLEHQGPLTNPYEGLVIGNGDLAASAQIFSHELLLRLGKSDVWDARVPQLTADAVVTHDELIASNGEGESIYNRKSLTDTDYILKSARGPTPKPVGLVRIQHPGLSDTEISSRVDLANGVLTVEYGFPEGSLQVEALIHREKNVALVKLSASGTIPWLTLIMEKQPDMVDGALPGPVVTAGADEFHWGLSQTIPEGDGVSEFSWHLAGVFPQEVEGGRIYPVLPRVYALEQDVELQDGASVTFAVGVATDRDGAGSSLQRARELATESSANGYAEERRRHDEAWKTFWAASAIELEDKELEAVWYRAMFGFACHLKPGAQAPGLNANIPIYDYSGWNGFYTWNHNVQKWYFPALAVNHAEWYEPLADLVEQHLPVFEHLAELIFGLDGVYVDLMTAPYAPPERAKTHSVFGRALAHTGWLSVLLYQHYEFTGDRRWLEERAYPYIREAAIFYADYLDKYQGEDGDIYPSMLLEDERSWLPGFARSRNTATDLAMFDQALEIAVEASELLQRDGGERRRWAAARKRVPQIDFGWREGRGWYAIYKDWEKTWPDFDEYLHHLRTSRWGNSGWLIFPGEYLQGDEPEGLAAAVRDVLAGTDLLSLPDSTRMLGTFHGEGNFLPFIRAGLTDKFDELRALLLHHRFDSGQFSPFSTGEHVYPRRPFLDSWRIVENQYFPILGVTEMLLQSQGGLIRLFPFWPEEQAASFRDLRARDGFMVTASYAPGGQVRASIRSELGSRCRIKWSEERRPLVTSQGRSVDFSIENGALSFATERGASYALESRRGSKD